MKVSSGLPISRDIREKRDIEDAFVVTDPNGPKVTIYESRLGATVIGTDKNNAVATEQGENAFAQRSFSS